VDTPTKYDCCAALCETFNTTTLELQFFILLQLLPANLRRASTPAFQKPGTRIDFARSVLTRPVLVVDRQRHNYARVQSTTNSRARQLLPSRRERTRYIASEQSINCVHRISRKRKRPHIFFLLFSRKRFWAISNYLVLDILSCLRRQGHRDRDTFDPGERTTKLFRVPYLAVPSLKSHRLIYRVPSQPSQVPSQSL